MKQMKFLLLLMVISGLCTSAGFGQADSAPLKIVPLTKGFYVFMTYHSYKGNRISANGLYVVTNDGVVMFDTPWDTTQFKPLLDSIQARHNKKVVMAFATHFHEDRTAGLEYYKQQGVKTYTTRRTDELSRNTGKKRAEYLMQDDTAFVVGDYIFETYYPGHGHAPDNIVIWFKKDRVLYGGCLIKSTDDTTLGNLGDADVNAYAATVQNVITRYKKPSFVIPGHNGWQTTSSLNHTYRMAKDFKK